MRLRLYFLGFVILATHHCGLAHAQITARGYAAVTFRPGLTFIANQFKGESNTVAHMIPYPAEGAEFYKLVNGTFTTNTASGGVWKNPNEKLEPGEGAIVFNPGPRIFTGTFAGELHQGDLVNRIPAGLSIKSSLVPQEGPVTTGLQLQLSPFDNVYLWKTNRYEVYTYLPNGAWIPSEPRLRVGESFFIRANQITTWSRSFRIN